MPEIDRILSDTGDLISQNYERPDTISLPLAVSFAIIDTRNHLHFSKGELPLYIDPSQLDILPLKQFETRSSLGTNQSYLTYTHPIENQSRTLGYIIGANPALPVWPLGVLVLAMIAVPLIGWPHVVAHRNQPLIGPPSLDSSTGELCYANRCLKLPLDSNQFYLVKNLIRKPGKSYPFDQLVDHILVTQVPLTLFLTGASSMMRQEPSIKNLKKTLAVTSSSSSGPGHLAYSSHQITQPNSR
jgi:hypothetical protein